MKISEANMGEYFGNLKTEEGSPLKYTKRKKLTNLKTQNT